jgi:hypothetical protein
MLRYVTLRHVTDILVPLLEWRESQIGGNDRKLIIHADSTHPHTARVALEFLKQNGMKRTSHLPYSSDLAPAGFYLFGYIKQLLAG